jgi:GNAT superfamily N-acetyltransferase
VDAAGILALYDRTMRRDPVPLPPGYRLVREGGLTAIVGPSPADQDDNTVIYAKPDPATVDAIIASAIACFAGLGHGFEWKLYRHDNPNGALAAGLVARGFVAGETETLMALDLGETDMAPASAADVRRLETPAQLADIVAVQDEVGGGDHRDLIEGLAAEWRALPDRLAIYVARVDSRPACTGWIRFHPGRDFADLWGGATLPHHRGRGLYRALVAARAAEARRRGVSYLTVDAGPASRPILARLGFEALDTITSYYWRTRSPSEPG